METNIKNIICTLGPASHKKETIMEMADSGMCIARLNFSHGNHGQHQIMVDTIRAINEQHGYGIKILQDLEGYRIRIGQLKHPITVEKNQHVWLSNTQDKSSNSIPLDSDIDIESLTIGTCVFINDGMIALRVIDCPDKRVELVVENGGVISSKKGVNIPEV
ncbi:MAG: pyruvate kinase, partial [Thermodesulfobacteriota bacterium]